MIAFAHEASLLASICRCWTVRSAVTTAVERPMAAGEIFSGKNPCRDSPFTSRAVDVPSYIMSF
jgi:hypothetical protein